ncbi:MAG: hypothetical protein IH940_10235 [Acidobacteria bacterium]|nr:hypothetical protein [Acidobacteriota bacterium]
MTKTPTDYSSAAVGWSGFAAVMLILIGVFDIIQGFVAIVEEDYYVGVVGEETAWVFEFSVTSWGWIHLIGGIILVLSGFGIFSGNVLGRTVGVAVAGVAAIYNFAWMPYAPVWSIIVISMCIAVIWALTAHGRDITYS